MISVLRIVCWHRTGHLGLAKSSDLAFAFSDQKHLPDARWILLDNTEVQAASKEVFKASS